MLDQITDNPTFFDVLCRTIRCGDAKLNDTLDVGPHEILGQLTDDEAKIYNLTLALDSVVNAKQALFFATPYLSRSREKMEEELESLKEDFLFFSSLFREAVALRFGVDGTYSFMQFAIVDGNLVIRYRHTFWTWLRSKWV